MSNKQAFFLDRIIFYPIFVTLGIISRTKRPMNRNAFTCDLVTQRFIKNRWDTEVGQAAFREVMDGLKNGTDLRQILEKYVLSHADNQDPYNHPYYPKDAMQEGTFWVLSHNDLRGIEVYNEAFPGSAPFRETFLDYSFFYNCQMFGINLEKSEISMATFENCNLEEVSFAHGGGQGTRFLNCNLQRICYWDAGLVDADLSGSDMTGIYLESARLRNLTINYQTKIDQSLNCHWKAREMPAKEIPDHFKAFRIAFEKAELWQQADRYLFLERRANRQFILNSNLKSHKSFDAFYQWVGDMAWDFSTGYGTKPSKLLVLGFVVSLLYAVIYYCAGNPGKASEFSSSLYFSFTTFATLGYGDLSYTQERWMMRLISTTEAWVGAVMIAAYVAVLGRKVIRH